MSYLKHKPGSIEEVAANMSKYAAESEYQDMFKKELEKAGKGIGAMTPKEKKAFFNKIDSKYTAKDEETKINEISDKDKRDNLQKIKAINDMVGDIPGVNNNEYKRLVDLGKPLNYYENPRGATDVQKKQFTDFAKKFSNKMSSSDKREYEGYLKSVTEAVDNPYAVGMAQAMKAKNDQPPLKKSTITKAHDIAKSIEKDQKEMKEGRFEVSGTVSYKGVNSSDDFEIVVDAPNEQAAEKKIDDMIFKARDKREIGPRGGRGVEDYEIYNIERTTNKVTNKFVTSQASEKQIEEVEIKEGDAYQNDRFAVSGNTAKIDNSNTPDKSNHVHAPNAKTAVAMYKAGVKSYKDTTDMRKKFPMANETHSFMTKDMNKSKKDAKGEKEIVDPKPKISFKEAYKKVKENQSTIDDSTQDRANQGVSGEDDKKKDPDIKKPKGKADTGSKATPVDTSPEVEYKN